MCKVFKIQDYKKSEQRKNIKSLTLLVQGLGIDSCYKKELLNKLKNEQKQ